MVERNMLAQAQLRRYYFQKAAMLRSPISGTFELTPRCNMNCRMCYIRMSPAEMAAQGQEHSAQEWIELGRHCVQKGMLFLLLTGGEPFLRPDFRQIYTELKKLGLMISINTNGTLIDQETVEWLSQDPPAKISITLYGDNNETYHQLCGHPTGYDAATTAVDMLREAGILVHINSSFTPCNIRDMEGIIQFAKSRRLQVSSSTYMFPPVRKTQAGCSAPNSRFSPQEAGIARARSELLTMEPEILLHRLQSLHAGLDDHSPITEDCERSLQEKMGCMAGKASFWVTWDGRMTPCGMMNQPVAYPFKSGFDEAWKLVTEATDRLSLPAECSGCKNRPVCTVCGALCAAESGSTARKPEYLCQQTAAYLAEMELAYQQRLGGSIHEDR